MEYLLKQSDIYSIMMYKHLGAFMPKDENNNENNNNINDNNINIDSNNNIKDINSPPNIFSNSLFNEFTSYATTELKESNIDFQNNNNNKDTKNENKENNNALQNIKNNKSKRSQSGYYKNYNNIFNEIERYQINYEKMKKENHERNNKINNLLEKKNKNNLYYLKLKLKNSKYYNDDDLKNESIRDLNKELEKIKNKKETNNKENVLVNDYKYKKKKNGKNPLIEEFNKFK